MELFTIDDEGLHRGIEITLGTEWLCSVAITADLRARVHEAAECRAGHSLPWATDLRVLLASAAYHAGFMGKRLDSSSWEIEQQQQGNALVLVDVHGAPATGGTDGRVTVEYGGHNTEIVTFSRRLVRTRVLVLVAQGGWIHVQREGDTSVGGLECPLPTEMAYRLVRPGGGSGEIIPTKLTSDRWVEGVAREGRPATQELLTA